MRLFKNLCILCSMLALLVFVGCSRESMEEPGGGRSTDESGAFLSSADGSGGGSAGGGSSGGNGGDSTLNEAGQLTAGEWNDIENWDYWQTLLDHEDLIAAENSWKIAAHNLYRVRVLDRGFRPVVGAQVLLIDKSGDVIWNAQSNNEGESALWKDFSGTDAAADYIEVRYKGEVIQSSALTEAQTGVLDLSLDGIRSELADLDVYMVIDATGSMGDEITYIQAELEDVIKRVGNDMAHLNIRLGATFYRDQGDDYLTKDYDLSGNADQIITNIQNNSAGGGGDWPEAVDAGLEVAVLGQDWSDQAVAKLVFLVLDAPPHEEDPQAVARMERLMREAAARGIRVIPVTASGIDKRTEFLMRMLSMATNGTYTFITDHSGIGGDHVEPTIGDYEVEYLNNLMVRLIRAYAVM